MEPAGPDGPMMLAWRRFTEGETMVAALALPRTVVLAPFHERLQRNALVLLLSALPLGALGWITARAQRRAALSEARFRGTFEQAAVGVAHVGRHGRWLRANTRLCDMLGYAEAELRQRTVLELTHPDDRADTTAMTAQLHGGAVDTFSLGKRYLRKDGTILRAEVTASLLRDEVTGRGLHGVAVIQDIGARMAAEAALATSEERLALASAAAGMGVYDVDTRTGDAVVNAQYRQVYGLPPGEGALPVAVQAGFIHPDDRARVTGRIDAANREGGDYHEEFRILRQDTGEVRWVASRGSYVGDRGATHRFIGVTYDITERKREQEREMLLAREVDHRARNVLAVVRSIVRLSRADDPRQFADAVEGRVSALARAHTLLARDRWTRADIAEVAREELAAYSAAEGGPRVTLDGSKLRLRPDAVQPVSMVLHELATNAAKHGALSTPSGHVAVSWRLVSPERAGCRDDGRIVLVWQEGGGPEPEDPPTRRGFGSIVVEATVRSQLGGDVGRDWAPGGLRCEIVIPADRALAEASADDPVRGAAASAPETAPAGIEPAGLDGRRVLVVEDEPLVALDIATTLEDAGCEVVGPAATLQEALDLAEAQTVDAAVLDGNLRGESSHPVAALLFARSVPVIYVTGYSSLPSGVPEGAHLLSKPLRDGLLVDTLCEILGRNQAGGFQAGGSHLGGAAAVSLAAPARPATASAGSPS